MPPPVPIPLPAPDASLAVSALAATLLITHPASSVARHPTETAATVTAPPPRLPPSPPPGTVPLPLLKSAWAQKREATGDRTRDPEVDSIYAVH